MISGALTSIRTLVSRVYQGLGRPGIELKITLISIITFIPFIIVGIAYGVVGLAFAVLFHTLIFDSEINVCNKTAKANLTTPRSEEHTSKLQSRAHIICSLL